MRRLPRSYVGLCLLYSTVEGAAPCSAGVCVRALARLFAPDAPAPGLATADESGWCSQVPVNVASVVAVHLARPGPCSSSSLEDPRPAGHELGSDQAAPPFHTIPHATRAPVICKTTIHTAIGGAAFPFTFN